MPFRTSRRLNFGDCDPSGIAYFPSYLHLLVGVMEEFFASIGANWPTMISQKKIGVPTVRLDLTFSKPGLHGDILDFALRIVRVGNSSLDLEHTISCEGEVLWSAVHRVVATSLETNKACPWPDDLRTALTQHMENDHAHNPAA